MSWSVPRTWTDGETPDASMMNALRDQLLETEAAKMTAAGLPYATGVNQIGQLAMGAAGSLVRVADGGGAPAMLPADGFYPWTIDLWAWGDDTNFTGVFAHGNTNFSGKGTGQGYGLGRTSTGAQNAEVFWYVILAAGTWNLRMVHRRGSSFGIYTVSIDGVSVGTIDGYNATTLESVVSSLTGIVVASSGKKELKLRMATKHASSSSYFANVAHLQLMRTA